MIIQKRNKLLKIYGIDIIIHLDYNVHVAVKRFLIL